MGAGVWVAAVPFLSSRPGDVLSAAGLSCNGQRSGPRYAAGHGCGRAGRRAGHRQQAGPPVGRRRRCRRWWLQGGCEEDLQAPYQPFIEAIRAYAGAHPEDVARLGASAWRLARIVPELTALVSGPQPRESGDPDVERLLLFEAVVDLLGAAARERPAVLVLDDLQWVSRPTLLMLGHVCRSRLSSVLVLLCYRNTELGDAPGLWELLSDLHRLPTVRSLTLTGLDEGDVVAYVEATGERSGETPGELGHALYARTEGNPLFVRELLAHVSDSRRVDAIDEVDLPGEVRDLIERRLRRVSSTTGQVLAAGAVAGPSFSFSVLERVPEVTDDPRTSSWAWRRRLPPDWCGRSPATGSGSPTTSCARRCTTD